MARPRLPRMTIGGNLPGVDRVNRWIEDVLSAIERATNVAFEGNVNVSENGDGMRVHVPRFGASIVQTTSSFPARSGMVPGQGTATHMSFNGTSFVANAARTNQKMYNFSAATSGIGSGKFGFAVQVWGFWFVIAVEC